MVSWQTGPRWWTRQKRGSNASWKYWTRSTSSSRFTHPRRSRVGAHRRVHIWKKYPKKFLCQLTSVGHSIRFHWTQIQLLYVDQVFPRCFFTHAHTQKNVLQNLRELLFTLGYINKTFISKKTVHPVCFWTGKPSHPKIQLLQISHYYYQHCCLSNFTN